MKMMNGKLLSVWKETVNDLALAWTDCGKRETSVRMVGV
jgi:hypothetical protein